MILMAKKRKAKDVAISQEEMDILKTLVKRESQLRHELIGTIDISSSKAKEIQPRVTKH